MTPEGRKIAYDNMKAAGIDALIVIVGYDTALNTIVSVSTKSVTQPPRTTAYSSLRLWDVMRDSLRRTVQSLPERRQPSFPRTRLTSTSWSSSSAGDSARARTAQSFLCPRAKRTAERCTTPKESGLNIRSMMFASLFSDISRGEAPRAHSTAFSPAPQNVDRNQHIQLLGAATATYGGEAVKMTPEDSVSEK